MNIEIIGFTLDALGKIMIAYTALKVHHRFYKEHKVDELVFIAMKKERNIALIGIVFIVVGYLLQLQTKF